MQDSCQNRIGFEPTLGKHLVSHNSNPSPEDLAPLSEKLKKALLYVLLTASSSWGVLAPTAASAAVFSLSSFLQSFTPQASASARAQNSQTLPLLTPATNIDPNPSVGGGDVNVVDGSALVAEVGPSGTAADLEGRTPSSAVSVHVVREGENISTIAEMYGVSVNTIKWANDLSSSVIHEGQELVILPVSGIYHTVKQGDTVASLAKKYSATESDIREHNDLPDGLVVGTKLLIPNGTIATLPAARPAARATSGAAVTVSGGSPYSNPLPGGVLTQGIHGYNGIDIGAPAGTPIYASAAGRVVVARASGYNGGYGSYVVIQHQNSQTLYAHMSAVLVSPGDTVQKGEAIGRVGNTGKSTGNHLHFEVRGAINPFAR